MNNDSDWKIGLLGWAMFLSGLSAIGISLGWLAIAGLFLLGVGLIIIIGDYTRSVVTHNSLILTREIEILKETQYKRSATPQ